MATAAHLREMLLKASDYKERKEAAGDDPLKRPAFDMKLEALIPVLNREIPLKAHAHQANDIFTAIRISTISDDSPIIPGIYICISDGGNCRIQNFN